ncbi:PINc domain-containing protein [Gammaproteobacteria bacterium]
MKAYFFDTSALVKRYITEIGLQWTQASTNPQEGNKVILARITWVEMLSAFSRLKRESAIDETVFNIALQAFEFDWDTQYQIVEFDKILAERAYDSVQLASALKIHQIYTKMVPGFFIFVSADDRLLTVATSEGMHVENPIVHSGSGSLLRS